ncbi:nucleotidyltransferase family protein [Gemmata sp. G18]|uniref:Nucleotidyltransferase family protein n=1 Tax=Gemmata palustris TaxID=2822762 RepID=A0ABS5C4M0_9BACT|nr:nucleotidyltransferase family protein [Gemmata palustris]MBP3960843.1 nucleotidyltransferase family protein [Gemmata palustris]
MEAVVPYEQRLKRDFAWALREGSMHFEDGSAVQQTLRRITQRLDELEIPYAVVGGLALFFHGYRRFTEDVDILVTKDDLKAIHEHLEGRGYLPPFEKSKHLRDTVTGVKVEFLTTGDYPGDGKPKPVTFPNPAEVRVEGAGIWFLSLPALVELKLASGLTNPLRGKDIVDVQELITELNLGDELAFQLNEFVRGEYLRLVKLVRDNPKPAE